MKIFPGMLAAGLLASTLYACQRQAVSPAQLFLPPSNLVARSVSSSQLDLSWTDNANTETGFELQFATNAFFTGAKTFGFGPRNRTSFSHTGLDPITTLWYKIKAIGPGGSASAWSNPAFATTAPDGVVATALLSPPLVPNRAIKVDWMSNSANTNISGYTVRYSTAAGSCKDRAVAGGNGSSTYTATGLVPGQTYEVSVKAQGGAYSSAFSAPANATTQPDTLVGTRISPLFFGQNAWLPWKIGAEVKYGDLEELLCGASYILDGDLQGGPCLHAEVQASGVKLMRYGGKGVDQYYVPDSGAADARSSAQYLTMVDNMRANGIEPLLEVPWFDGAYLNGDLAKNAEQAADLVRYINITHDRCGRYWTIANEPDRYESNLDPAMDPTDIAANIASYFKEYVTAMRDVDPTIVIVGPDLATYDLNDDPTNPTINPTIMSELLTGGSDICGSYLGADGNNHYYLDVVDFHTYPFPNEDLITHTPVTQTRQEVIDQPSDGFQKKLNDLKALLDLCNSNRPAESVLKMAVTEINVEYLNPADLSLSGVSAQSFLAGQYWADVMNVGMKNGLEFMAFWSVKEGGPPQLGYIAAGDDNTKLPTYYHYQMLAQNFRGVYAAATSVKVFGGDAPNMKAFGAKDVDQIVVMLLNESQGTLPLTYTVRLDTAPVTGNNALKVNIAAGVSQQYGTPAGGKLAPESTVMLVFDASGTLQRRHVYDLSTASVPPTVYPH